MESPVVFILFLATITFADHVHSQGIYASANPIAVGSNVTLVSNANVTAGGWLFNNQHIVLILGNIRIAKAWKDRITYNTTTSTLTISSLKLEDSGEYTLEEMDVFIYRLTLSVQDPISNVTLEANATSLVEFKDAVVLMCSVSKGTSLSYEWLNDSSVITANGDIQLSNGNATLTIMSVTRYNQGPFRCNVSNSVSNKISPPVNLSISYGPSNTEMMIMPLKNIYEGGSNITLSCSAESSPPAMIWWMVNGVHLNQTGSKLQLENVSESNSGNYTCLLHNTITSRFSSTNTVIWIVDPLTAVVVNLIRPAILGEMFSLSCEVTGPFDIIYWLRNGQIISADNKTAFGVDNKTLTLNSVLQSDGGNYQCQAFNSVSNMTSDAYRVTVNYGPEMATAMGPNLVKAGETVTFNCSAVSVPPSLYKWYFQDILVSNESEYITPPLTTNMSGKYICVAFNNINGKNSTAYIMLTVVDPLQNVNVKAPMNPAKEGYLYTLTCNVTGPADHIYWMKNGETLQDDNRTVFYMDNTVHFNPVERSDTGNYQCMAINAVGNMTSSPYMLIVNYGPETPVIHGPAFAETGHQAVFSCSAMSVPPSQLCWLFNGSIVANTSVYTIDLLSLNMSGQYTCMAINNVTEKNSTNYAMLAVIDPIKNVKAEASMNPAKEGYSYSLTCNVTGSADHIYWMKNGETLQDDNTTIFCMDNTTVHFNPVERSDTGNHQCMARNAVGNMTSPPYMLIVNYGPETPVIHGPAFAETGRQAVFNCSAISVPPSQFCWLFNGSIVANTSVYTTGLLSLNMSGQYTCMAINNVTEKNSTNYAMLTVIEAIESVMIQNNTIPIDRENFTLTCEIIGPYDRIYWMKDNMKLNMNTSSNMSYSTENNMLHFTPVTTYSDGTYQCVATNKAGQHVSPHYMLLVNYGPLSLKISRANMGMFVSLTCTADSRPTCDFYWFFNQSTPVGRGSVITFSTTTKNMGDYLCKAWNHVTNITMYQNYTVTAHASTICFPYQGSLMMTVLFALSAPILFN